MIFKCLDESQLFFFLCTKQSWLLLAMHSLLVSAAEV